MQTTEVGKASVKGKRLLADVLRDAAELHLNPVRIFGGQDQFTCVAVAKVEFGRTTDCLAAGDMGRSKGIAFMKTLGCPYIAATVWGDIPHDEFQGVRYMWLLLAACAAEDEGIELP